MRYAIKKLSDGTYLNHLGGHGELEYAYVYECKHKAEKDAYEGEEAVCIIQLAYSQEDLNKLMNELSAHKGKASARLLEELRKL